ncbi:hypothetical protein ONZ45_g8503 [Pleurotus djamor]|nr:hypothetical protein ONZ45_g8503 [Pleurotus djamor]
MAFPVEVTVTIPQPSSVATGQPAPCYSNSVSSYVPDVQPSSASYPSWHSSSGDATWWPSASRTPGTRPEYVYVEVYKTDYTAVAVLASLLGLAVLYILISSFIRPKILAKYFARKTNHCTHCQRDMSASTDLEAAQYSEASLDAKGKGIVLFEDRSSAETEVKDDDDDEKDDVNAPLLGSK